jgi:putative membrane protein insertion efficiency factor
MSPPPCGGSARNVRQVAVGLIIVYQRIISPLIGRHCRYHPTCSQYAKEAMLKHGFLRGAYLGAARVLRCNPWNPGGVDFVP